METTMDTDATPWYRQGWPWFLISFPAAAVIAGSITFYLAASGWDGPVAADYYRKGLAINEQLARTTLASDLGIVASVRLDGSNAGDAVRVVVRSQSRLPAEAALKLRLVHPGRNQADRIAVLSLVEAGDTSAVYSGYLQAQADEDRIKAPASWQLIVETQQWRLDGEVGISGEARLNAAPAPKSN